MGSPFCIACGATIADTTRFCVKCGQAVGQTAPPPPHPGPPAATTVILKSPSAEKSGSGVAIWIGIIGFVLLGCGAGLWFYTTHQRGLPVESTVPVAAAPSPEPESVPSSPAVPAPAPTQSAKAKDLPPNPEVARPKANPIAPVAPLRDQPVQDSRPQPVPADPTPPPSERVAVHPAKPASPTSGVLHASVEVGENGEVVFENLPGARLKFTFDREAWRPTISRQANGTQTLIMRSLKPGIQRICDVRWEIVSSGQ